MAEHMNGYEDYWLTSPDGLGLYARDYPNAEAPLPVLCLHGLTRNAADFEALAQSLQDRHRLIVMDQRGRGRADYDPNPANYNVMTYVTDTFALLDQLEITQVALIGTSMGGLMAMLMASQQPGRFRGVVLNDVGPVVDAAGIARIQSYVGRPAEITSWADAAELARANNQIAFPDWNDDDWLAFAARTFVANESGVPALAYDPAISAPLTDDQASAVPPDLWPVFDAMADVPTLVVRGVTSDILSRQTLQEMRKRHHDFASVEIPDRGHAPTLDEALAFKAIEGFLARIEANLVAIG